MRCAHVSAASGNILEDFLRGFAQRVVPDGETDVVAVPTIGSGFGEFDAVAGETLSGGGLLGGWGRKIGLEGGGQKQERRRR